MASNDIKFKVIATADGFDIVQKKQKGLADQIDKTNKSTKNLDKTQQKNYGRQKQGLIQTANGTKNFAKLSQTIGSGSSGLVGAYATLAANVFAASAAFNALRQAAAFEQLAEGFTFMANESGRTTSLIVERLKEITGQALSTKEALEASSLALSAGFDTTQLETLAKVARGASLALGRNLNDAFDRLTRGAIKLEPEILDELGIMVRLDDATEAYAATLGKTAKSLTQFERQTAFLNAINEQGIKKYGALAEAVDTNPYDRLAAAFDDLTKRGFTLLNVVFIPLVELFAGSSGVMVGGLVLFGSTILTQMIPALGQMSQRAAQVADDSANMAKELKEGADQQAIAARATITSIEKPSKSMAKFQKKVLDGTLKQVDVDKQLVRSKARLSTAEATASTKITKSTSQRTKTAVANAKLRIDSINAEILALESLSTAEQGSMQGMRNLAVADMESDIAGRKSAGLIAISGAGPLAGFKEANAQFKDFSKNADLSQKKFKGFASAFNRFAPQITKAGVGLKFYGSAVLNFIPALGMGIFLISTAVEMFKKYNAALNKSSRASENLGKITETLPDKFDQLNDKLKSGVSAGEFSIAQYKMTAGILLELSNAFTILSNNVETEAAKIDKNMQKMGTMGAGFDLQNTDSFAAVFQTAIPSTDQAQAIINTQATENLKKVFADDSRASQLLKDTIVAEAKEMGIVINKLGEISDVFSLKDPANSIRDFMIEAYKEVNRLNVAFQSLQRQVSDGEKVYAKFFDKFEVKTEFDDLVDQFTSMTESIAMLESEGKTAEIEVILDQLGTGAKKFGLTAKSTSKDVQRLADAFGRIRKESQLMQTNLKRLSAVEKVLKSFADVDASVGAIMLETTNARTQAQINLNNFQLEELDRMTQTEGVKLRIQQLETNNLELQTQLKSDTQIMLQMNLDIFENDLARLKVQQQLTKEQQKEFVDLQKIRNLRSTGSSKGSAESEFNTKIKAAKEEFRMAKAKAKVEDDIMRAKRSMLALEIMVAVKTIGLNEDIAINALEALKQEQIASDKLFKQKEKSAQTTLDLAKATALESDSLFVAAQGVDGLASKFVFLETAISPIVEGISGVNEAIGLMIGNIVSLVQELVNFSTRVDEIFMSIVNLGGISQDSVLGKLGFSVEGLATTAAALEVMGSIVQGFSQVLTAETSRRIGEIDQQIEAEEKRDGKSAASLAKTKALEAKKEQIAKKSFETNKKLQIASAIISTAAAVAGIMAAEAKLGVFAFVLAAAAGALGMAQVALIRKTQYSGGGAGDVPKPNTSLSIGGQRSNKVDVSQGASAGETAYLRGGSGVGSNANNFTPGGAMGRKGYADGGMLVGERGPEVVTKEEIIPNYALGGNNSMNLTFNVSALDGASVQEVLTNNQGAVVGAIRDAANSYGQDFLPDVNVGYGGDG